MPFLNECWRYLQLVEDPAPFWQLAGCQPFLAFMIGLNLQIGWNKVQQPWDWTHFYFVKLALFRFMTSEDACLSMAPTRGYLRQLQRLQPQCCSVIWSILSPRIFLKCYQFPVGNLVALPKICYALVPHLASSFSPKYPPLLFVSFRLTQFTKIIIDWGPLLWTLYMYICLSVIKFTQSFSRYNLFTDEVLADLSNAMHCYNWASATLSRKIAEANPYFKASFYKRSRPTAQTESS